jgi:hypothetical protein
MDVEQRIVEERDKAFAEGYQKGVKDTGEKILHSLKNP